MGRTLSEINRYGPNWDAKRKEVLRRDDHTCQRCGHQSGPYAGDEGRVLQAHHINKVSDGGSNELSNLRTLCRPCHGVQHPDNDVFDGDRPWATIYPPRSADETVAYVNSNRERESVETYLDRKNNGHCQRCGNIPDESCLYVYPNIDFGERGEYTNPAEKFASLCGPCAGLVYDSDTDDNIEDRIYRTDGNKAGKAVNRLTKLRNQAQIVGANKARKFDATRDPVNRKEWFLFKSPYRFVHACWRTLGTLMITAFLFLLSGPYLERLTASINAVNGVGPTSAWFFVTAGGLLASVSLAFIIRWSIAAGTDRVWDHFDNSIEPHHFNKQKVATLRRRLKTIGTYFGVPYAVLCGIQLLLVL